jgi:hypothetical protein
VKLKTNKRSNTEARAYAGVTEKLDRTRQQGEDRFSAGASESGKRYNIENVRRRTVFPESRSTRIADVNIWEAALEMEVEDHKMTELWKGDISRVT